MMIEPIVFALKAPLKALAIESMDRHGSSHDADGWRFSNPRPPAPMPNEIHQPQNFREHACYASDQTALGTNHHATVTAAIELRVRPEWLWDDPERFRADSCFPILQTSSTICGDERSGLNG
jgi:hypothetical protein